MSLIDYSKDQLKLGDGVLAATQEENWDWYKKHVERAAFPDSVASPDSALVLAGPATYEEIAPVTTQQITSGQALLTPIGFVGEISFQEGANIVRMGEIGSRMPRFVIDRTAASGTISRAMFNASTLAYVLYQNALKSTSRRNADSLYDPVLKHIDKSGTVLRFKTGIWSDMFKIPFGMAVCFRTVGNDYLASAFLEQCYISNYEKGESVGQAIVLENISFEIERVRPVKIQIEGANLSGTIGDTGSTK